MNIIKAILFPAEQEFSNPDFSIQYWANRLFISRSTLHRLVKAEMGKSPQDYVRFIRVEAAKVLLKQGYTITETAEKCGFSQTAYFSRLFKQATGVTPSEWRESKQTNE
jgi:AraC-like DNA-binding protein